MILYFGGCRRVIYDPLIILCLSVRFYSIEDAMLIVGRSDDDKEKPQDIVDKD